MKQNIPMPLVIGAIVGVLAIVIGFVVFRGSKSDGGFDAKTSQQLQMEAYKRKTQGGNSPGSNTTQSGR